MNFFFTLTGGTRKKKQTKKFSFLNCIQKSNVIKKNIWDLVFSFTYLVLVDVKDRSKVTKKPKDENMG